MVAGHLSRLNLDFISGAAAAAFFRLRCGNCYSAIDSALWGLNHETAASGGQLAEVRGIGSLTIFHRVVDGMFGVYIIRTSLQRRGFSVVWRKGSAVKDF